MKRVQETWKRIPDKPRRVLVFVLGCLLIIAAGVIGVLPGPGGTVIFLLAIAVLASEFAWALKFRDLILDWASRVGEAIRRRPILSTSIILAGICAFWGLAYAFYTYIR